MIRATLLWLALAAPAAAATVDGVARRLADDPAIPGAAVGVVSSEGAAWAVAGRRAAGDAALVTEADAWHLGSLTKAMTATLAARLQARGLIDWDDPIRAHLAQPGPMGGATLTQLLNHRSGLPANMPGPLARGAPDRGFFVAAALRVPLSRGERGAFHYSNVGYVVAGAMLEAAGGDSWEALMAHEVFAPLGMAGAGFGPPPRNLGHRAGPVPVPPGPAADNPAVLGPAGTIHATPADLAAFLRAHLTWDEGYLSPDAWERLQLDEEYALGWSVGDEGRLIHTGSNTLWWAVMEVDHAADRAVFVMVNTGDQAAVRDPIISAVRALRGIAPEAQ